MERVMQHGGYLKYLPSHFRNNDQIVQAAFDDDPTSFRFAGEKYDENIFLRYLKLSHGNIEHAFEMHVSENVKSPGDLEEGVLGCLDDGKWKTWKSFILRKLRKQHYECLYKYHQFVEYFRTEEHIDPREEKIREMYRKEIGVANFKEISCRLDIFRFLGRGSYGATYLCRIVGLEILLAMKLYTQANSTRKKRVELVSRDSVHIPYHKNVVSILGSDVDFILDVRSLPDYKTFWTSIMACNINSGTNLQCGVVLMPYHRNTLEEIMKFGSRSSAVVLSPYNISIIIYRILEGVTHLHENMIVHRDLHPGNIFLDCERGRVWVGDFGCALDLRNNQHGFKVDEKDEILLSFCSPPYICVKEHGCEGYSELIAPEIGSDSDGMIDYSKSDLYSVGALGNLVLKFCMEKTRKRRGRRKGKVGYRFNNYFLDESDECDEQLRNDEWLRQFKLISRFIRNEFLVESLERRISYEKACKDFESIVVKKESGFEERLLESRR